MVPQLHCTNMLLDILKYNSYKAALGQQEVQR